MVRGRLAAAHGVDEAAIDICVSRTSGDRIQDRPLSQAGGKGLFAKEIEDALLAGDIDLAVHSVKDMPTALPDGLLLAACPAREDVRDAFIGKAAASVQTLPHGAALGTASLRRQAMAKRLRPDLRVTPLRGNVEARLRKLGGGELDATILALAGLKRLGLADVATSVMDVDEFLPAVGQGAVTIEIREADTRTRELAARIDDADTSVALTAERAFLGGAGWIVPHADRRLRHDGGGDAKVSRNDPAARRWPDVRDHAQRCRARCARARSGRGCRTQSARACGFFRMLSEALSGVIAEFRCRSRPLRHRRQPACSQIRHVKLVLLTIAVSSLGAVLRPRLQESRRRSGQRFKRRHRASRVTRKASSK